MKNNLVNFPGGNAPFRRPAPKRTSRLCRKLRALLANNKRADADILEALIDQMQASAKKGYRKTWLINLVYNLDAADGQYFGFISENPNPYPQTEEERRRRDRDGQEESELKFVFRVG
jgi:hypothetical protein